jgi:transcription elongation factor GreA
VFGATVELLDEESGNEVRYQIVGEDEADIKAGRVSITSPIARALIGKQEGDVVALRTPGGDRSYEILAVEYL